MQKNQYVDLHALVEGMDKLSNEPDGLIADFENVCEYFIMVIKELLASRKKRFSKYERGLLSILCRYLERHRKQIDKCRKNTIINILNFKKFSLSNKKFQKTTLRRLRKDLITIRDMYKTKCFANTILNDLFDNPNGKESVLFRLLRTKYSTANLGEYIRNNFSKEFFSYYQQEISNRILGERLLTGDSPAIKQIEKINQFFTNNYPNKLTRALDYFYNNRQWIPHEDFLVDLSKHYFELIFTDTEIREINDFGSCVLSEELVKKMLLKFCKRILKHVFFMILNTVDLRFSPDEAIQNLLNDSKYFSTFSSIISSTIQDLNKNPFPYESDFSFATGEVMFTIISEIMSEQICEKISGFIDIECANYKITIVDFIHAYSWSLNTYFNTKREELTSSLSYRTTILGYINSLIARSFEFIVANPGCRTNKIDTKILLSKLIHQLFLMLGSKQGFGYIPQYIDKKMWSNLIIRLLKEFKNDTTRSWQLILPIGNLDCKNKIINLGQVVLYDSRKWDLGENYFIDSMGSVKINMNENFTTNSEDIYVNPGNEKLTRNSGRAIIYVNAYDQYIAVDEAMKTLQHSLNSMVFMFPDEERGFKPQPVKYFQLIDTQSGKCYSRFERERAQRFSIFEIEQDHLEKVDLIDNFLQRPRGNDRILRSIEWYRRGTWDNSEHETFTCYWIALEHLITTFGKIGSGSTISNLLHYVPKITTSWRVTTAMYPIGSYVSEIIRMIDEDVALASKMNNDANVNEWKKGYVLLENLDYLEQLVTGTDVLQPVLSLKSYLTPDQLKKIKKEVLVRSNHFPCRPINICSTSI
jgi:hypothetical protein